MLGSSEYEKLKTASVRL